VPLSPIGAELLFNVVSDRYERGSILLNDEHDLRGVDQGLGLRAPGPRDARALSALKESQGLAHS
jgi:hypothetical protein